MVLEKYIEFAKDCARCIDANRFSLAWLIPANLVVNLYFFIARADNSHSVEDLALKAMSASIGATLGTFIFSLVNIADTYGAYRETEDLILEGVFDRGSIMGLKSWYSYRAGMELACRKWGFENKLREVYEEKA